MSGQLPRQLGALLVSVILIGGCTAAPTPHLPGGSPAITPGPTATARPPQSAPSSPVPVIGLGQRTVRAVSVYGSDVCVMRPDRTVACWGEDGSSPPPDGPVQALGGRCALSGDGTLGCWGNPVDGTWVPSGIFSAADGEASRGCALRMDGSLACWRGPRPPAGTFRSVSVGDGACAIRTDGRLACWGWPDFGDGPGQPPAGEFTQVSVNSYGWACALRTDGSPVCWGNGAPQPPSGVFTAIDAGGDAACGIRSDSTLICWPDHDTYGIEAVPDGSFKAISVGETGACAVRTDSRLACWGGLLPPGPSAWVDLGDQSRAETEFRVSWTGRPIFAPILSYDLRVTEGSDPFEFTVGEPWMTAARPGTALFTASPGKGYIFILTVRDSEGVQGTATSFRSAPFDDGLFKRSSGWTEMSGPAFYGSTALRSFTRGSTLRVSDLKAGAMLFIVATTCPTCGKISVHVPNVPLDTTTIDLRSATRVDRRVIEVMLDDDYQDEGEGTAPTTVVITVTSAGKPVIIDGIIGG